MQRVLDFDPDATLNGEHGVFFFEFPFDRLLKDDLKENVPNRAWNAADHRWIAPLSSKTAVARFALRNGFAPTDLALQVIKEEKVVKEALKKQRDYTKDIEASKALHSDLVIEGLTMELHAFQNAGVEYALTHIKPGKGIYIADQMGLGKSPQSLAVVHAKDAFPALVVVPNVVWLKWAREVDKWLHGRTVALLAGKTVAKRTVALALKLNANIVKLGDPLPQADIYVVSYSLLAKWVGLTKAKTQTGPLTKIKWQSVIFDEAHYLKEPKSQRTKAALALVTKTKPPVRLALSGTPILNRPKELLMPIVLLDRLTEVAPKEWDFLIHYCNGHKNNFGWDFSGHSNLDELNHRMRSSFFVRRETREVLADLPPIQFVPVDADMATPSLYDAVEARLDIAKKKYSEALRNLERSKNADDETIKKLRRIAKAAENKVGVISNEARLLVGQLKLPFVLDWIQEFLDDTVDEKIIIFGIHREVNEAVAQHFNAPLIYGGVSQDDRYILQEKFQNDPTCRILVAQVEAAGVGLDLTAAKYVAFIELPYRPADIDQAISRAYGRMSDIHGITAFIITVAGTIEIHILDDLLDPKRLVMLAGATGT